MASASDCLALESAFLAMPRPFVEFSVYGPSLCPAQLFAHVRIGMGNRVSLYSILPHLQVEIQVLCDLISLVHYFRGGSPGQPSGHH